MTASFSIIRSGYAYRTKEHVVGPDRVDFSDWNWPETGNLNGGRSWHDSFTFNVDDAGKRYDGELNRAEVYTSNGNRCFGGDPHVYGVVID